MQSVIATLALALLASGCGSDSDRLAEHVLAGETMGTTFSVKIVQQGDLADKELIRQRISDSLAALDQALSTYKADSNLSEFNRASSTNWVTVSQELCDVVDAAQLISRMTNGAFDITVGPLVNLWGFGPSGDRSGPPDAESITAAKANVGHRHLETDCDQPALRKKVPDLYVDLSGFAKGHAVDRIAEILDEFTAASYLVEIGGEVRMKGHNAKGVPWAIAVEKPLDDSRSVQSIVQLTDSAMATSGDYRNFFEWEGTRYSHTIDPATGYPVAHSGAAVTVIADSTARADGLATALLVLGPDKGMTLADRHAIAAYFLVRDNGNFEERMSSTFASMKP
jgi:thiamine biosynthesis lipoprotein